MPETLWRSGLEGSVRRYGQTHQETVDWVRKLTQLLQQQGRQEEAEQLRQKHGSGFTNDPNMSNADIHPGT